MLDETTIVAIFDHCNIPQGSVGVPYGIVVLRLSFKKGRVEYELMRKVKDMFF